MVNENYYFENKINNLDPDNQTEGDQNNQNEIDFSSQSDSKLYEETLSSFPENQSKNESNKDVIVKRCPERIPSTQINPVRAESMIRQTITKMEKHRTVIPGMASARSLTNLISADYGWTPAAVYGKVEKALKSAVDKGIVKEMFNKENGRKCYTVPDAKVKKYINCNPLGPNGKNIYKKFSDLMNNEK